MTLGTYQELPNRLLSTADKATIGSTTASATDDPVRLTHDGTNHFVWLPGESGNYLSVPDEAALDLTGDFEIVFKLTPTTWTPGSGVYYLYDKADTSYAVRLDASGGIRVFVNSSSYVSSALPFADGDTGWIKVTRRQSDGRIQVLTAPDAAQEPATFTQLGSDLSGHTSAININGVAPRIGGRVSGGSTFSGVYDRIIVRDGIDGTEVLDINPAADIDTSSDPDAGQTSFTATTGQTVTVNRSTTAGYRTAVIVRSSAFLDGINDVIDCPTSDRPTITPTSGKFTALILARVYDTAATHVLFSTGNTSSDDAIILFVGSSGTVSARVEDDAGTGASSTISGAYDDGNLRVFGVIADEGTVYAYESTQALGPAGDYSGGTTITHLDPRFGSRAGAVNTPANMEFFDGILLDGLALTKSEADLIAAKLLAGDYS